ncbi:MAG TPA: saccharopine dehydrogenase C-terminal domain-containing protein, partial [Bacteroidales bacterium]|nr:saccharopine dehydrogenase C-terminal domain-containing protein [Bacteroidales bacterium]
GGPVAVKLAEDPNFNVTLADIDAAVLDKISAKHKITVLRVDLSEFKRVKKLVASYGLVVSAVPGFLGFMVLKACIEAGKDIIDFTFQAENFLELDSLAKEHNVTAICDMGLAPGMSNLLAAYASSKLDKPESVKILVGGLPVRRSWPFEYKAVFSPIDLVEEYTRPARFVVNGNLVVKPALSDVENVEIEGLGTLEAFNSDGLRSLIHTLKVPDMIEKTLRYPGHVLRVQVLRDAGFFSTQPMMAGNVSVRPIDVTAKLLFPILRIEDGEEDLTVMRIIAEGYKDGKKTRICYDLLDTFDPVTRVHSMARTTGYAAVMAVKLVASQMYTVKGVSAPEHLAADEKCVDFILNGLKELGINYTQRIEAIE